MSDYIDREAAIKVLCDACGNAACPKGMIPRCSYYEKMLAIPAADVRPVVLCRDCKYCRKVDEFEYWCDGFCSPARLVRKDDYCSHGSKYE